LTDFRDLHTCQQSQAGTKEQQVREKVGLGGKVRL
jgi:hypothetical protein